MREANQRELSPRVTNSGDSSIDEVIRRRQWIFRQGQVVKSEDTDAQFKGATLRDDPGNSVKQLADKP